MTSYRVSIRTACKALAMNRATYYYKPHGDDQALLRMKIRDYATSRVTYGYRRIHVLLQREGFHINKIYSKVVDGGIGNGRSFWVKFC